MPITYRVNPSRQLIETRIFGEVTRQEIEAHRRELETHPDFRPSYDAVIDLRELGTLLGTQDLREMASEARAWPGTQRRRVALVSDADAVFGLMRLFESHAEGGPTSFHAFRTMDEALDWLGHAPEDLRHIDTRVATRRARHGSH